MNDRERFEEMMRHQRNLSEQKDRDHRIRMQQLSDQARLRSEQQKRMRYESALANYQVNMSEWNSLSETEKNNRHQIAEAQNLLLWTLFFIALQTYIAVNYLFDKKFSGDELWIYSSVYFVCSCILFLMLAKIIGRFLRGGVIGVALYAVTYWGGAFLTDFFFEHGPSLNFIRVIAIVVGGLGFLAEWGGAYHASAEPKAPSPP